MKNEKYIVYFISRMKEKTDSYIAEKLKEEGLDELIPSHGNILEALYESGEPVQLGEIARKIGRDKSTVTPLAKKLENLGYIGRFQDRNDRRKTYVYLTEKGEQLRECFNRISEQIRLTAYEGFSENDKELFLNLMKKMYDNFSITGDCENK